MVSTFEHFIFRLFVNCCCLLAWTAGSPVTKIQANNRFIEKFSSGEKLLQGVVTPELPENPEFYSNEYFLEGPHGDLQSRQIVKRHAPQNIRVPQYMMDIYTHLQDKKWVPRFDIARSYYSVKSEVYPYHKDVESKNIHFYGDSDQRHTFHFNITKVPRTEKIEFAQLRLYAKNEEGKMHHSGNRIRISISWTPSGAKEQLISSRDVHTSKNSCITFNITGILTFWVNNPEIQQQLKAYILNLEHVNSSQSRDDISVMPEIMEESQILVFSSYIAHNINKTGHSQIREKRDLEFEKKFPDEVNYSFGSYWEDDWNELIAHVVNKRSEDDDEEEEEMSNFITEELGRVRKGKLKKKKNPCRRRPLHVNFASINYDQWIIAPPGYDAFECTGKCTFPMSAHLTPTKHAIIQTLIHGLEPKGVARACCVPTKLDPIPVLYVDDKGVVTYKDKFEDMVVAECGCR